MRKILVPVDASKSAEHAVRYAAKLVADTPSLQLHLLNIQEPLDTRAHAYMSQQEIKTIQTADSQRVLQAAMAILDDAGVPYRTEWRVGDVASTIAAYAQEIECEGIVMGTRGLGAVTNLMMGSVAYKVVHLVQVPVTLVK
ncbi:MAG TPA: universal stress protein [Noviherbaspirillum sp.]|uniref:universal stress protein n=1 Tax=Noviherbaspirillum sp. TaxID=1926288 RepID=UPI002D5E5623|nr:universal stress protein [Noviherbaspirillum sp.]HYD95851.1 universal stress protein [Noviherbaspirillum sp.]